MERVSRALRGASPSPCASGGWQGVLDPPALVDARCRLLRAASGDATTPCHLLGSRRRARRAAALRRRAHSSRAPWAPRRCSTTHSTRRAHVVVRLRVAGRGAARARQLIQRRWAGCRMSSVRVQSRIAPMATATRASLTLDAHHGEREHDRSHDQQSQQVGVLAQIHGLRNSMMTPKVARIKPVPRTA